MFFRPEILLCHGCDSSPQAAEWFIAEMMRNRQRGIHGMAGRSTYGRENGKRDIGGCRRLFGDRKMYNGIINIYKEKGYTSHDVVAKLRGILKQKKIGHTGTLDPEAEGVLPVCLGSGTKLCSMLTDEGKEYRAVLLLGYETDTQDMTGRVLAHKEAAVTETQAAEAILSFVGGYAQIPPMYSAVKVDGKKLYQLARAGKVVARDPRQVQIHQIEIEEMELPRITMRVACSKGTYIRTLCHDIGQKLGCGGAMAELVRTKAGSFGIGGALRLSDVEALRDRGELAAEILPVDSVFAAYPKITVERRFQKLIENGNAFYRSMSREKAVTDGQARVYDEEGRFYGVFRFCPEEDRFIPVRMFMENG